jgi:hypothetical protein
VLLHLGQEAKQEPAADGRIGDGAEARTTQQSFALTQSLGNLLALGQRVRASAPSETGHPGSGLMLQVDPSAARDLIAGQLDREGFAVHEFIAVSDTEALIARRSRWLFTAKMHEFVVVFTVDGLSGEGAARLAKAAQSHAIRHKGGLPRGLQSGTLTTVVFLDADPQEGAVEWVDQSPVHRYAAMLFAVLIDVTKHEVVYWDGRWTRGWIYRSPTLDSLRRSILVPLSSGGNGSLKHVRASGTNEEKLAAAIEANQAATRRTSAASVPVILLPIVVILYLIGGLGPAITGLVLGGAGLGLGCWVMIRISSR